MLYESSDTASVYNGGEVSNKSLNFLSISIMVIKCFEQFRANVFLEIMFPINGPML